MLYTFILPGIYDIYNPQMLYYILVLGILYILINPHHHHPGHFQWYSYIINIYNGNFRNYKNLPVNLHLCFGHI